jgi:hypothetical protein
LHFVFATCAIFYFIKWTLYSSHQQIENWKAQTNFFCLKQKQSWQLLCLSGNTSSSFSRQLYQLSKTYIDLAFNANWQDIFLWQVVVHGLPFFLRRNVETNDSVTKNTQHFFRTKIVLNLFPRKINWLPIYKNK